MSSWVLRAYNRSTERVAGEWTLKAADSSVLRHVLHASEDDPLFDSFPVSTSTLAVLAREYDLGELPDDANYFIEFGGD
jgi:hypothetical protein